MNPTCAEVQRMIRDADKDDDGDISFPEFVRMIQTKDIQSAGSDDLEKAFKFFDKNGDGHISATELRDIMTTMGEPLTAKEVDEMIWEADRDGNGKIDYIEFCRLMGTQF